MKTDDELKDWIGNAMTSLQKTYQKHGIGTQKYLESPRGIIGHFNTPKQIRDFLSTDDWYTPLKRILR